MPRKKVDHRIPTLVENGVKLRHRTLMFIVGDKGRDQIVNLHYMLSKASVRTRPSVLWCYKKDLGFTTHRKKRVKKIKRDIARGLRQPDEQDPFELFVGGTDIRYTYYKDTHKILGTTFGMCVLQDFEALTPNLLARTAETVEGGGLILVLLKTMTSLKQLYTMSMDCHKRYRTAAHHDVVGRFNERFLLSLGKCDRCIVVDDELNILPLSSHVRNITKMNIEDHTMDTKTSQVLSPKDVELADLKTAMKDSQPVGELIGLTRTLDQAKAVLTFIEAVSEKTLRSTVVLTAARGRGKSCALGIAMAGAIAYDYSNVFVTAPSPENLGSLFEMVLKGFDALGYKEHTDYEIVQSNNSDFNKAIVRVNIFKSHRQTIQYIKPKDAAKLGQAELLVIDEAAAIPLPMVKKLMGRHLVFMSSTINGYEGTGRSLSLKLVADLRKQSAAHVTSTGATKTTSAGGRTLRELTLEQPIRYAEGDSVETWLNDLLCLDCQKKLPRLITGVPHPSKCDLFFVNRDTLFSGHKAAEAFLQRMMALYVSSHYKNSPNDLQLMSDAPAHRLFVLLGPVTANTTVPDILCVVQVALEGEISKQSVLAQLARGKRESGDLIPWIISQQYQDNEFASLSGARIVRIATHPELQRMGYGSRAVQLINAYYEGKLTNLSEKVKAAPQKKRKAASGGATLATESIAPRKDLPPLLQNLAERQPEPLHYIGTSFGLTQGLFNYWKKLGLSPVYIRQTANDLTGEHSTIMIKALSSRLELATNVDKDWLKGFCTDFQRRFLSLSSYNFSSFKAAMALSIVEDNMKENKLVTKVTLSEIKHTMTDFDVRRLKAYGSNLVDYHMIMDLVPSIARLWFLGKLNITLSYTASSILLGLGLQHKTVSELEEELKIGSTQILAIFNKSIRKVTKFLAELEKAEVKASFVEPSNKAALPAPVEKSLEAELIDNAAQAKQSLKKKQDKLLDGLNLNSYAIGGTDAEWNKALKSGQTGTVSLKSTKSKASAEETPKKTKKRGASSKSAKKGKRPKVL